MLQIHVRIYASRGFRTYYMYYVGILTVSLKFKELRQMLIFLGILENHLYTLRQLYVYRKTMSHPKWVSS